MKSKNKGFRKYIIGLWTLVGIVFLGSILFFWMIAQGKLGFMPSFEELENPKNQITTEIITSNGAILGKYYKGENRIMVTYQDLSSYLIQALVSTEDERYYEHSGIDLKGLGRVVKGVLSNDLSQGGGSTISQQLAKLLFPRESISGYQLIFRKFREWVIAVKLERSYTKEEIIAMYLNKFEFIYNAFGINNASKTYFNKKPSELKVEEAAMLIGMLKNPWIYNPRRNPKNAVKRRNIVMGQMLRNHYLNIEQYDSLKALPLNIDFQTQTYKGGIAPYFRKYLERTMIAHKPKRSNYGSSSRSQQRYYEDSIAWFTDPLYGWCNKNIKPDGDTYNLYKDGLKIYVTLDSRMQRYAEESVEEHLKQLQPQLDAHVATFNHPPFSNDLSEEEAENNILNEIKRSHRYKQLKKRGYTMERIREIFETPDTLMVYTWDGYKDSIMSPLDSIKYYLKHLSSSLMAMDPNTGEVKAWVGGAAYGFTEIDMVRSSTYKRQVGSTCKPFLYTLAMQNGMSPCKKVPNVEVSFALPTGETWTAKNSDVSEMDGKMVTLRWGLANSVNQISAWVMKQYSPELMLEVMRKMGIYSDLPAVPSMFLGTGEITLYEMVAAYSTFANKGVYTTPLIVSKIEDKNGNMISSFSPARSDALDRHTAYLMINLLQNVVNEGSGRRLRFNWGDYKVYGGHKAPFAAKTGTTQNQSDGWFVGFTPELVAGVWTGANYRSIHFEDLRRGQGANMALPAFGRFFKKVFADSTLNYSEEVDFEKPEGFDIDLNCNDSDSPVEETMPELDNFF